MTVGGGIRSSSDVEELLRCGADKVAVNTAAVNDQKLSTKFPAILVANVWLYQ